MIERRETLEKHGVIFALWDGEHLQLEERRKPGGKFFGQTIIPGGGVEVGETLDKALKREVREEYRVKALKFRKLGVFPTTEDNGVLNFRHLYLVTKWKGKLSNPEQVNGHTVATIEEAFRICEHPLARVFLTAIQEELSRQNS